MSRRVKGPDGVVHVFPDDATDAEISAALEVLQAPARSASPPPMPPASPGFLATAGNTALDFATGAVKGLGRSVVGAGELVAAIPGVGPAIEAGYRMAGAPVNVRASLAAAKAQPELTASNTAQRVGQGAEQIAEFFALPTSKAGLLARIGTEAAGAGLLTAAQGGSPTAGAVAGAAGPIIGKAAAPVAEFLRAQAGKGVAKFLGATTKPLKAEAERLEAGILDRGLGRFGTTQSRMAKQAAAKMETLGPAIAEAEQAAAASGGLVEKKAVVDAVDALRAETMTPTATGALTIVPGMEAQHAATQPFREFLDQLPDQITIDQAADLKRKWQTVTSLAKGYGVETPTKMSAMVSKDAAAAMRKELLKAAPDLENLYREYGFWAGLENVLDETLLRTRPQAGWGKKMLAAGAAAAVSGAGHAAGSMTTTLGAPVVAALTLAVQSPTWHLASAQWKRSLADAIVSGKAARVSSLLNVMGKGTVSQATAR